MCFENQVLFYKCRKSKNLGRLSAVWFFNDRLSVKTKENGPISKIYHVSDLEKLLKIDNTEELINVFTILNQIDLLSYYDEIILLVCVF